VNIDANNEQEINIDLGELPGKSITGRILRSGKLQDYNSFDNPKKINPVAFTNATLKGNGLMVKIPPFSVVVLEIK
jgi:alpha-N-arabinofuranosidase